MKRIKTNLNLLLLLLGGILIFLAAITSSRDGVNAGEPALASPTLTATPTPPPPTFTPVFPPPTPTPDLPTANNVELVGHLGGIAEAVFVQSGYAYAGFGPELAIIDISSPTQPLRAGYLVPLEETSPLDVIQSIYVAGNYAYLAAGERLYIVDVSDPSAPVEVGVYETSTYILDVSVMGTYAYLAAGSRGLRVLDISNPSMPDEVSFYFTQQSVINVATANDYAYIVDGIGLYIVNVSNPGQPVGLGFYDGPISVVDVTVVGNYAYVAAGYDGLRIVDISDPQNPIEVATYEAIGALSQVVVNGNYAYLRIDEGEISLRVVDISDPTNPLEVGFYDLPGFFLDLAIANNYAYISDLDQGLQIINISDPTAMTEVGFYRTFNSAQDVALDPAGDYVYIGDGEGLHTVNILNPALPTSVNLYDTVGEVRKVVLAEPYAFLVVGAEGVRVLDLSDPASPVEVGLYESAEFIQNITVAGDYLYTVSETKLHIVDISNPTSPNEIGTYDTPGGPLQDVAVAGAYAYIVTFYGELRIVDISDPAAPVEVSYYYLGRDTNRIVIAGGYAYLVGISGELHVLDISDPTTPSQVGDEYVAGYAIDLAITDGYAYITTFGYGEKDAEPPPAELSRLDEEKGSGGDSYLGGLWVVDISDPTQPVVAGHFTTSGRATGVAAANGLAYVVDEGTGFFILRKLLAIGGQIVDSRGLSFSGATLTTDAGPEATIRWIDGSFSLNPPLAGTYTFTPTLAGYTFSPPSRTVTVPPDAYHQDFTILPAPVSILLQPGAAAELVYTDTQGLPTHLTFPPNAVAQPTTLVLTPTTVSATQRLIFTGHAFDLIVYQAGVVQPDFTFNEPVIISISYSQQDVWTVGEASKLGLWRRTNGEWHNIVDGCGPVSPFVYTRDLLHNRLEVPICHTGHFGLFGVSTIQRGVTIASVRDQATGMQSTTLQEARDMDMLVLVPLSWRTLEVREGEYEWAQLDDILRQANYYGRQVILRVYHAPLWHTPFEVESTAPPSDPQTLHNFMFNLVTHIQTGEFSQQVLGYVIWNEPNIPLEWGGQNADPDAYIALLKAAYQGAKAADPDAVIISAGLAPTETSGGAINDLTYLGQLYDLGLADYVDYIGLNGLGFQHPPDHDSGTATYNFNRLKYLHEIMLSKGDYTHRVWALEVGWLRDSSYDMADFEAFKVSAEDQARYLFRAWQKAETEWPWLDLIVFWNLDYSRYYPLTSNFHWYSIANTLAEVYLTPPGPVSIDLTPDTAAELNYTDPIGVVRHIYFPADTFPQPTTMVLWPTLAPGLAGFVAIGNGFELEAYQAGTMQPNLTLDAPLEVSYYYSCHPSYICDHDQHVATVTDENQLTLWWWNGSAWQDAAETCDPSSNYDRDLDNNILTVGVCQTGQYVLVGPTHQVYLPVIFRMD